MRSDLVLAALLLVSAVCGYCIGVPRGYSEGIQGQVRTWSLVSGAR